MHISVFLGRLSVANNIKRDNFKRHQATREQLQHEKAMSELDLNTASTLLLVIRYSYILYGFYNQGLSHKQFRLELSCMLLNAPEGPILTFSPVLAPLKV